MLAVYLKKYRNKILCSLFFFYLGCVLTLSFLRMDCAEAIKNTLGNKSGLDAHNNIEYAVVILSRPSNYNQRNAIRKTWMRLASNIIVENGRRMYRWNRSNDSKVPYFIRFYFVIGVGNMDRDNISLLYERESQNDILLLDDAEESYKYLSKKMLKTMEWFSKNLKNLKYLIKCDDDSFVRIDLIIRDLEAYAPHMNSPDIADYVSYKQDEPLTRGLYWGYFNGRARVYLSGKWKEQEWFLCDRYLPYALGGGYVISKNIVDYIGRNHDLLGSYKSEDVSMGVWTASLSGVNRVHDIRFDTEWQSRGCLNDMFVRHKQNTTDMDQMYKNLVLTRGIKLCSALIEIRKTYRYNWNVLPNRCCQ